MKKLYSTLVIVLVCYYSYAQTDVTADITAIGLGATSSDPNYKFNYQTHSIAHYGLGWYDDSDLSGPPMAYLGGYGGIKLFTEGSVRLYVNAEGKVGIGTTTPNAPLHIAKVSSPNTSIPMQQWDPLVVGSGYNLTLSNYNSTAGIDYRFTQFQQGIGYPVLTFQAANVGIGTNNPDQKLTVNGTIHSKEVKVDMNGWSDYVFNKTYSLPALTEVKTYIDKNQHLPEIPSEQEVIKDGLNLGEMNKLLLKKVEELTLYLIDLKRENDLLEKEQQQFSVDQQAELKQLKQRLDVLTKSAH